MSDLLSATDEEAALEVLHARGLTDGLPVVIPTPQRVARLVLATGLGWRFAARCNGAW